MSTARVVQRFSSNGMTIDVLVTLGSRHEMFVNTTLTDVPLLL